jgi:hypothetical protein
MASTKSISVPEYKSDDLWQLAINRSERNSTSELRVQKIAATNYEFNSLFDLAMAAWRAMHVHPSMLLEERQSAIGRDELSGSVTNQ